MPKTLLGRLQLWEFDFLASCISLEIDQNERFHSPKGITTKQSFLKEFSMDTETLKGSAILEMFKIETNVTSENFMEPFQSYVYCEHCEQMPCL